MIRIDEEFQAVMRPLDQEERARLEESILKEGCRDPVVVWSGVIVDGKNRYQICTAHGIPYKIHEMEFPNREEAMAWIIRNQLARRNLGMSDKARLVSKLLPLVAESHRKEKEKADLLNLAKDKSDSQNSGNDESATDAALERIYDTFDAHREVAAMAGMSHDTVAKAKKVMDKGTPEQKKRLDQGTASIHKLYTEIREREKAGSVHSFNPTTERVGFAKWTWNPYTGCIRRCKWCYARDMAERLNLYDEGFEPTFRPERLQAPFNTPIPASRREEEGIHRVFVCSMGELFGLWVDPEHRDKILDVVFRCAKENTRARPKIPPWTFIFLTKYPYELMNRQWPENVWVGASVTDQSQVEHVERAFTQFSAPVKFLSCEPMHTDLTFTRLNLFDMVMIGARTRTSRLPAFQPEWPWVEHLLTQCREAGCAVYFKDNLKVRPQEHPGGD